jgi:excisionase family DNA binding protein
MKINFISTTPNSLAELIAETLRKKSGTLKHGFSVNKTDKEILTRKEVATLLSISLVTVHDWIKVGILKPYKLGNRTFFKRSEIMEALNNSNPSRS